MRVRRRNVVVWSSSAVSAHSFSALKFRRLAHPGRIRRGSRIGALLSLLALVRLAHVVHPRWRPLLAGGVLTAAGFVVHGNMWGALALPLGFLFFYAALLIPDRSGADRKRLSELRRELAGYSTPAQRRDLEATLDRYPDSVTRELRDILACQAMTAYADVVPGAGAH